MVSAVLFDIDGVLVDSEPLHDRMLQTAIAKVLGARRVKSSLEHIGLSLSETLAAVGVASEEQEAVRSIYVEIYCNAVTPDLLRAGAETLWRELVQREIPFGCVTSAERQIARANLALLATIATPPLVARENVTRTKPYPEPYLALAARLGHTPDQCLAIEDSDLGLAAATAAGVGVSLAFPHDASIGQTFTLARGQITCLTEILELI